jgi:hypothetical protein
MRSFIQRLSQVRNTIPRISNASVVDAFRQGVRDEKMLEKLATHDIQDVSALFSLADKCTKAAEGHAWHSLAAQAAKGERKPNAEAQAQGGGSSSKKKKKKKAGGNQPLAGAPTAVAAAAGGGRGRLRGDKHPSQSSNSDDDSTKYPVHNSTCHTSLEYREIKKLVKQFRKKMQQQRQGGVPSRQWEGKQKVHSQEEKDAEMEFQDTKRALKGVYGHSDSESSDNEHRKTLHVIFGGSWAITFRRVVKTLRREVAAVAAPKAAPHCKWVETPIEFDSFDCPKSMAGVGQLPLLVSPTISNVKLYHILIDGGAALNLISLAAFKKLQILMGKL